MAIVLAATLTRNTQFRIHAPFPMDGQNHFARGAVYIGDDFLN